MWLTQDSQADWNTYSPKLVETEDDKAPPGQMYRASKVLYSP